LNQQNRGNNRRRGRGGNRQQGGQANRIDSRARGNAPQMLEKYKKLAHDAQMNGDRVQSEYYLQFADHYFRVVADSRVQRDDRSHRDHDREHDNSPDPDEGDDDRSQRHEKRQPRSHDRSSDEGDVGIEGEAAHQSDDERPSRTRSRANGRGKPKDEDSGFDSSILPPAIGNAENESDEDKDEEEKQERPRRRARRARSDDDDGAIEAVG
jgi:hypothetical protein